MANNPSDAGDKALVTLPVAHENDNLGDFRILGANPAPSARLDADRAVGQAGLPPSKDIMPADDSAVPANPKNPEPSTWQYDRQGHLTKAGDIFSAQYDAAGQLQSVQMNDETWKREGNAIEHTYKGGRDNKTYSETIGGVTEFSATALPEVDKVGAKFQTIDVKVGFGSGSSLEDQYQAYKSPAHLDFLDHVWRNK